MQMQPKKKEILAYK